MPASSGVLTIGMFPLRSDRLANFQASTLISSISSRQAAAGNGGKGSVIMAEIKNIRTQRNEAADRPIYINHQSR